MAVAMAAPTSISVRSFMSFSKLILPVLLCGSPLIMAAQSQPLVLPASPRFCAGAAQSVRDWGWSDESDGFVSSLSWIVSVVNRQLRSNAGHLRPTDIAHLRKSVNSDDPCVRELSLGILKTQTGEGSERKSVRVADAGTPGALRNSFASTKVRKRVTRSPEKQSPTREAITP
jgi:hypothetical protein